jgi:hypothetical protein
MRRIGGNVFVMGTILGRRRKAAYAQDAAPANPPSLESPHSAPVGVGMVLPDFNVLIRRMNGRLWAVGWAQFLLGSRGLTAGLVQFIATSPRTRTRASCGSSWPSSRGE